MMPTRAHVPSCGTSTCCVVRILTLLPIPPRRVGHSDISMILFLRGFFSVYLFLRRGEGERENSEQAPHAVSAEPDAGLELTNCETTT